MKFIWFGARLLNGGTPSPIIEPPLLRITISIVTHSQINSAAYLSIAVCHVVIISAGDRRTDTTIFHR